MAAPRPEPRHPRHPPRRWSLSDALAGVPAPLRAQVTYGEFEDPHGGQHGVSGGYTDVEAGQIYLRTRPKRPRRNFALGHELFHLLDKQVATDADHARWQMIFGLKGPWDQGTGTGGLASPSEIVADNFAMLATRRNPLRSYEGGYAESYDPQKLRRFANSLERLRKRQGLDLLDLKAYG